VRLFLSLVLFCSLADVILKNFGRDIRVLSCGGAAGGFAAGFYGLLNCRIRPGFELISETLGLEETVKNCDLILTGEGSLDETSFKGKVPGCVAELCKRYSKPCIFFGGRVPEQRTDEITNAGMTAMFSISNRPMSLQESQRKASILLKNKVEEVLRVYLSSRPRFS